MKSTEIIIVSHTHWDREWYLTYQQFRHLLVRVIDRLLNILENDPDYAYFLLDGQAILLEDYLEVRPNMQKRINAQVQTGRLGVGPWYVLPDEFLVSGEALIRNLLLGHRVTEKFGTQVSEGYLPDMFGQISQMPQILRGFEISSAFFFRGVGDWGKNLTSEFWWEASDGSTVLAHNFFAGYDAAADLLYETNQGDKTNNSTRLKKFLKWYKKTRRKSSTSVLLMMHGGDHRQPQVDTTTSIRALSAQVPCKFLHGNLNDFVSRVLSIDPDLPIVRGEMRGSFNTFLVPGTLSSRMMIKQMNSHVQDLLEHWVEPLATLAWLFGQPYDNDQIWMAWRLLLITHPHDSIAGCSIDQVHSEMMCRFHQAEQLAQCLIEDSLTFFSGESDMSNSILICNPLQWEQSGQIVVNIDYAKTGLIGNPDEWVLLNSQGLQVPFDWEISENLSWKSVLQGVQQYLPIKIKFTALNVPSFGYSLYRLINVSSFGQPSCLPQGGVKSSPRIMENEFYRIEIDSDGTFSLFEKQTNRLFTDLNSIEDGGDAGDAYMYSPPIDDYIITHPNRVDINTVEETSLQATIRIVRFFHFPGGLTKDGKKRDNNLVEFSIISSVTLISGSPIVEIETSFDNTIKDHRLRVLFPTDLEGISVSRAEGAFDVVERPLHPMDKCTKWEKPSTTHPQQNFVEVISTNGIGFALANKGLPEYELLSDRATLALTLLRGVGNMVRQEMQTRQKAPLLDIPAPDAQCLGFHCYKYAIIPASVNGSDQPFRYSYSLRTGLTGFQACSNHKQVKDSFLVVNPSSLIVSTIKKTDNPETEGAMLIRLWNPLGIMVNGSVCLKNYSIRRAALCKLNEKTIEEELSVKGNLIQISVKPKQILSLLIWPDKH